MSPLQEGALLQGETDADEAYWRSRSRPRITAPTATIPIQVKAGVTLSIALSWVLTTELAAAAQDAGFGGYTLLYFSTSMLSLFRCNGSVRKTRLEPRRGGQTAVSWATPGFLVLWLACNLAFMLALTMIRATTVTAVFSTNPAFVYVLSVLILKEPHDLARIFAVLLAVAGVYLTTKGAAHAAASDGGDLDDDDGKDGNGGDDDDDDVEEEESNVVVGALLALLSAALAGLYKVLFYFVFGEATSTQVSAFLGNLGVLNLTVGWVPLLVMWTIGGSAAADMAPPLGAHPGAWLLAALYALASAFFNFSVNLGVARTYPLFVSLGVVLGIPFAVAADCGLSGFGSRACSDLLQLLPLLGYAAIAVAFALLLMRDRSFKLGRAGQFPRDARTGQRVERIAAPPGASIVSAYSGRPSAYSATSSSPSAADYDDVVDDDDDDDDERNGGEEVNSGNGGDADQKQQQQKRWRRRKKKRGDGRKGCGGVVDGMDHHLLMSDSDDDDVGGDYGDGDDEEGGGCAADEAFLAAALMRSELGESGGERESYRPTDCSSSSSQQQEPNNLVAGAESMKEQCGAGGGGRGGLLKTMGGFKVVQQAPPPPGGSNSCGSGDGGGGSVRGIVADADHDAAADADAAADVAAGGLAAGGLAAGGLAAGGLAAGGLAAGGLAAGGLAAGGLAAGSSGTGGVHIDGRTLRIAFVGNSYTYYNDLPRLLECLILYGGPTTDSLGGSPSPSSPSSSDRVTTITAVETACCLRGGATLPGLLRSGGRRELVGPGDDEYGWEGGGGGGELKEEEVGADSKKRDDDKKMRDGLNKKKKPSVRGLLWGDDDKDDGDKDDEDKDGDGAGGGQDGKKKLLLHRRRRRPRRCEWDFVVLNDYSQQAAVKQTRAESMAAIETKLVPLLIHPSHKRSSSSSNSSNSSTGGGSGSGGGDDNDNDDDDDTDVHHGSSLQRVVVPVLYVTPAYRKPIKGSLEAIGGWEEFTEKQEQGHEEYRACFDKSLVTELSGTHHIDDELSASSPAGAAAAAAASTAAASNSQSHFPLETSTTDTTTATATTTIPSATKAVTRVASVNSAFAMVAAEKQDLWEALFVDDDFHPSPIGSFLAACVLHTSILGRAPCPTALLHHQLLTVGPTKTTTTTGVDMAARLFARSRRPLSENQPSGRLPTTEEITYLCGVAARHYTQTGEGSLGR